MVVMNLAWQRGVRLYYKCSHKDTGIKFTIKPGLRTPEQEMVASWISDDFPGCVVYNLYKLLI